MILSSKTAKVSQFVNPHLKWSSMMVSILCYALSHPLASVALEHMRKQHIGLCKFQESVSLFLRFASHYFGILAHYFEEVSHYVATLNLYFGMLSHYFEKVFMALGGNGLP